MKSSASIIDILRECTLLPDDISTITREYYEELTFPEAVRASFVANKLHTSIADECLKKLTEVEDVKELKKNKAEGPANALCELNEKQYNELLDHWSKIADAWENNGESKDASDSTFCSRHRQLIAYYLPVSELINNNHQYQVEKVRRFLLDRKEQDDDSLTHALRVKYAIADGNHAEAMRLMKKSSLNLNLLGADLSADDYAFQDIDLSYACLENTILGGRFFYREPLNSYRKMTLPRSLKGANLNNAITINHRNFELINCYNPFSPSVAKQLSRAKGGLNIRFRDDQITILHILVERDEYAAIAWMLKNGADPRVKNKNGDSPFATAIGVNHDFRLHDMAVPIDFYCFSSSSATYTSLLNSLNDDELNEQESICHSLRSRLLKFCSLSYVAIAGLLLCAILTYPLTMATTVAAPCWSLLCVFSAGMSCIGGIINIPLVLFSALFGSKKATFAIERQRLANKDPEHKLHLLIRERYYSACEMTQFSLANPGSLSLAVQSPLTLTEEVLTKQKKINAEFRNTQLIQALKLIPYGLILSAIALTAIVACFYIPVPLLVNAWTLPWLGSALGWTCCVTTGCISSFLTLGAIGKSISSFIHACVDKSSIDTFIDAEIHALRPNVSPVLLVPTQSLDHKRVLEPTCSPTLAVDRARQPEEVDAPNSLANSLRF